MDDILTGYPWLPKPSLPIVEISVRECSCLPADHDIMWIRPYEERQPTEDELDALKGRELALVKWLAATRSTIAIAAVILSAILNLFRISFHNSLRLAA